MEQSHVLNLYVFSDIGAAPTTAAASYIDEYTDLADGEFAVCNDQNLVLDDTTVTTDARALHTGIKLVGRYGTQLIHSDLIRADELLSYRGIAYADDDLQVSYIGYTGTGNDIDVINDNVYNVHIRYYQQSRTGFGRQETLDIMYASDATATQMEVAFGLEEAIRKSANAQAETPIRTRIINSAALVGNDRLTSTLTVVKGSKYGTASANFATIGGVTVAAVGDLLRLGAAADVTGTGADEANAAVALGSTVYKIISFPSATVVELDRPYTGASAVLTASTSASVIPAASVGDFGIRIDAVAPTHVVGKRPFQRPAFTIGLTDCGTTEVTYYLASSLGHGNAEQIQDLEWFCHGQDGDRYRGDYMYQGYTSRVVAAHEYAQIALSWANNSRAEGINGHGYNPKQLILACDDLYIATEAADIVATVLDAFAATAGFAASGLNKT